jgi:hypothetical protein
MKPSDRVNVAKAFLWSPIVLGRIELRVVDGQAPSLRLQVLFGWTQKNKMTVIRVKEQDTKKNSPVQSLLTQRGVNLA